MEEIIQPFGENEIWNSLNISYSTIGIFSRSKLQRDTKAKWVNKKLLCKSTAVCSGFEWRKPTGRFENIEFEQFEQKEFAHFLMVLAHRKKQDKFYWLTFFSEQLDWWLRIWGRKGKVVSDELSKILGFFKTFSSMRIPIEWRKLKHLNAKVYKLRTLNQNIEGRLVFSGKSEFKIPMNSIVMEFLALSVSESSDVENKIASSKLNALWNVTKCQFLGHWLMKTAADLGKSWFRKSKNQYWYQTLVLSALLKQKDEKKDFPSHMFLLKPKDHVKFLKNCILRFLLKNSTICVEYL